jgi:hypothetical protein
MIYNDKNTRNINSKHQNRNDDYRASERQINRKELHNIIKFRATIPLSYRFWFDSLLHDDKLSVISLRSNHFYKKTFEELMERYTGDVAKIRELKLNQIL